MTAPRVPVPSREAPSSHLSGIGQRHGDVEHCGIRMTPEVAARWPAERIAIVRRDYETGKTFQAILDDLNAIAGEKIDRTKLKNFARRLKLHRDLVHYPRSSAVPPARKRLQVDIPPLAPVVRAPTGLKRRCLRCPTVFDDEGPELQFCVNCRGRPTAHKPHAKSGYRPE